MKKIKSIFTKKLIVILSCSLLVLIYACSKSFLNYNPPNTINPSVLANKVGVEGLLIGAYSLMDGQGGAGGSNGQWSQAASNWVWGSVAGTDAHKGSDPGDQGLITPIETWNDYAANTYTSDIWAARFDGVQRCNETIRTMRLATDMTPADTVEVKAEALFLRAHYNFELRRLFGNVPWIDENISYSAGNYLVPNNTDIFPNIEADLQYAYDNLPETQDQIARANKWVAATYLAKVYVYEKKWSEARALLTTIIANGKQPNGKHYALLPHFADNFNPATKNGPESILAAQNSVNDGATANNANAGDVLNFPYGGPGGCCGFFQPSFSLANAFKVDGTTGLPLIWPTETYNNSDLKNDQGINSTAFYRPDSLTPLDPRIDWTIGRRGINYLDWGPMPGNDWIRNQASAGPYAPIKNAYYKTQSGTFTDNSSWTPGYTANNTNIIRFADVLLWAAEAEVMDPTGSLNQAMLYVNQVRNRVADTTGWVQPGTGGYAHYFIKPYTSTQFGNQADALKAIYFERRLELAMEGHRFFDLVRWGLKSEFDNYAIHEVASGYTLMKNAGVTATFTVGKSEYQPIPQDQIDKSVSAGKSVLTQNPGY